MEAVISDLTPQSKPRTRVSCSKGDTYLAATSSMRSSTTTRLPSSLLISRKVGACVAASSCHKYVHTVGGRGISSLHAPQAHFPKASGLRSLSQRLARHCSCLVWIAQQEDISMRAR